MKIILEKSLDFMQFQNLIILTFVIFMILLGMINSIDHKSYFFFEMILVSMSILFITILFTKKGLYIENNKLYFAIFIFGSVLKKTLIDTSPFQSISSLQGKLSTNYNYSDNTTDLNSWEPDLNISMKCFTLILINEDKSKKKEILTLTKHEKVKSAIDFIIKNTNLKYQ